MADYDYLDKGQDDGTILGKDSTRKIGFWGTTPVDQPAALTAQTTALIWTTATAQDVTVTGLTAGVGFTTLDEFATVMLMVGNLQIRLAEVEARLEECGIVAAN